MVRAFQSTLPVGGATCGQVSIPFSFDFNPRSPWGERLELVHTNVLLIAFQSTLPVGGATSWSVILRAILGISIHAPRGGSDDYVLDDLLDLVNFNPRSPWGERRRRDYIKLELWQFQSTLPVGGAT